MNNLKLLLLAAALLPACGNALHAQLTPGEAAGEMIPGINLGNTLEPPFETDWNNKQPAREYYFDMYREAGFKCVRIPVRWDKHTMSSPPYTISADWLRRVEELVDWGLERGLYIIINSHHDNWIKEGYHLADNRARFDSIWVQVSEYFRDKPERLIFEVLNEPKGLTKVQNDEMHARILSIIRRTNPTRLVVFQGNEWGGPDELIQAAIPDDEYLIGSFHTYHSYQFAQKGNGTWGTTYDVSQLYKVFRRVHDWSQENGIPVLFGEFGAVHSCDYNSRMTHYRYNVEYARKFGFIYCAWDDGGQYRIMERETKGWQEVKDILVHTSEKSPERPKTVIVEDTVIRVSWRNRDVPCDSIEIQRRLGGTGYEKIGVVPGDTSAFHDIHPETNAYNYYRVIAHDTAGVPHYSEPHRMYKEVYVVPERVLYLGAPAQIPGTVEAENFDGGGENLSWHDLSPANVPGAYRSDVGVDIFQPLPGEYHVGDVYAGEWFEQTVEVLYPGTYRVDVYIAALLGGGRFQVSVGDSLSDTLTAPRTRSWLVTQPVSTTMELDSGEQVMRFTVIDQPNFNLDKLVFQADTVTSTGNRKAIPFTAYQDEQENIVLRCQDDFIPDQVVMTDLNGRVIFRHHSVPLNHFPARHLPAGIYIIRAGSQRQHHCCKILIR